MHLEACLSDTSQPYSLRQPPNSPFTALEEAANKTPPPIMTRSLSLAPALLLLLSALSAHFQAGASLRTGAPTLACLNLRPMHGLHRPRPASQSPFYLAQSSLQYSPGQNLTLEIGSRDPSAYFRGFIVQAFEPASSTQLGHFVATDDSKPLASCSAATHKNNLNKHRVLLTWVAPGDAPATGLAGQSSGWLGGLRARPIIQPVFSVNVNNHNNDHNNNHNNNHEHKRQAPIDPGASASSAADAATTTTAWPMLRAAGSLVNDDDQTAKPSQESASSPQQARSSGDAQVRQVMFKGTIVVAYEDFYTGFESVPGHISA